MLNIDLPAFEMQSVAVTIGETANHFSLQKITNAPDIRPANHQVTSRWINGFDEMFVMK